MTRHLQQYLERQLNKLNLGMRAKLIIIFLLVKIIPLVLLAAIAWRQVTIQGDKLQEIAVTDSSIALNNSAIENIERMTTSAAKAVADFLYERDADIAYLAGVEPDEMHYQQFLEKNNLELRAKLTNATQIIAHQSEEIELLKKQYETLKIANALLGSEDNKRDTKLKINSLIREIDYCIAQLSD